MFPDIILSDVDNLAKIVADEVRIEGSTTEIAKKLIVQGEGLTTSDNALEVHGHIKLTRPGGSVIDGALIIVSGHWMGVPATIFKAQDLMLTNPAPGGSGKHIALSDMPGDILVINRDGGFPGGVQIDGSVHVPNKLQVGDNVVLGQELHVGPKDALNGVTIKYIPPSPPEGYGVPPTYHRLEINNEAILRTTTKGILEGETVDLVERIMKLSEAVKKSDDGAKLVINQGKKMAGVVRIEGNAAEIEQELHVGSVGGVTIKQIPPSQPRKVPHLEINNETILVYQDVGAAALDLADVGRKMNDLLTKMNIYNEITILKDTLARLAGRLGDLAQRVSALEQRR